MVAGGDECFSLKYDERKNSKYYHTSILLYGYTSATCVYVLMLKCTPLVPPRPPQVPKFPPSSSCLWSPPLSRASTEGQLSTIAFLEYKYWDNQTQIQYQDRNSKTNIISKKGIIQGLENKFEPEKNEKKTTFVNISFNW